MKTIEIKQKLVEEALDQLKAAQQDSYVQSTQNVIDELELALRQRPVISRSEQFICPCCGSDKTYKTEAYHCNRCAVTTEV